MKKSEALTKLAFIISGSPYMEMSTQKRAEYLLSVMENIVSSATNSFTWESEDEEE